MDVNKNLTKKEMDAMIYNVCELALTDSQKELKKVYLQVCSYLLDFEMFSENVNGEPNPDFETHKIYKWKTVNDHIPVLRKIKEQIHKELMSVKLDRFNSRFDPVWAMKEVKGTLVRAYLTFNGFSSKFKLAYALLLNKMSNYAHASVYNNKG